MFFKKYPVEYYEEIPPVGNWGDPTKTLVATYQMTIQPFTGDDALHNGQDMENVRDLLVHTNPDLPISKEKGWLKYNGEFVKIAYIQRCKMGVLPHIEIFTSEISVGG